MLPLADYRSKYLAILSATNELYNDYGCSKRPIHYDYVPSSRIQKLQYLRTMILRSLSKEECEQIGVFCMHHSYSFLCGAEILFDELVNYELPNAQNEDNEQLAENIKILCNSIRQLKRTDFAGANIRKDSLDEYRAEQVNEEPLSYPPINDNKYKIQKIIATLKANITQKKHGRATWYSLGVDNKITQLTAINEWLDNHLLTKENEGLVLRQIRDVCAIKRNSFGFFKPHSLIEYQKLLDEEELKYTEGYCP